VKFAVRLGTLQASHIGGQLSEVIDRPLREWGGSPSLIEDRLLGALILWLIAPS